MAESFDLITGDSSIFHSGTITVTSGTLTLGGFNTVSGATFNGSVLNQGLVLVQYGMTVSGNLTNTSGATLRVQADTDSEVLAGSAVLTVSGAVSNHGLIELTGSARPQQPRQLERDVRRQHWSMKPTAPSMHCLATRAARHDLVDPGQPWDHRCQDGHFDHQQGVRLARSNAGTINAIGGSVTVLMSGTAQAHPQRRRALLT